MELKGQFVDIRNRIIFPALITIEQNRIKSIERIDTAPLHYFLPGFIDAHIHIESSLLSPLEFSKTALLHGTVGTISDPHEIANVCGVKGVEFMIENARKAPLKIHFGAPSCVPATTFETSGATLNADDVGKLLEWDDVFYLAEVMNFPGVLNQDEDLMRKIAHSKQLNKPIDGHAPALRGDDLTQYIAAGITTDHECFTLEEALEKIEKGMLILIREGSAAKNFEALKPLLISHPDKIMFCSDDKHPDELILGHINELVKRSLKFGAELFDVLYAACIRPVEHYKMNVGTLQVNDPADFIVVQNLNDFTIEQVWIDGIQVVDEQSCIVKQQDDKTINNFNISYLNVKEFERAFNSLQPYVNVLVIEAIDQQIITSASLMELSVLDNIIQSDINQDILYLSVVNRYESKPVAAGFIKNFGLKYGALASSVAHDSHNIIVVGTDLSSLTKAVNLVIKHKGGLSFACSINDFSAVLPLPIAGLMTNLTATITAEKYTELNQLVKNAGSKLSAAYMTLSFMALPVIPSLKITDLGLFDVTQFKPVSLIQNS